MAKLNVVNVEGKKVGDIVEVQVPAGLQRFRIESISL
jgi:transcription elongation GreA/GreB family factor